MFLKAFSLSSLSRRANWSRVLSCSNALARPLILSSGLPPRLGPSSSRYRRGGLSTSILSLSSSLRLPPPFRSRSRSLRPKSLFLSFCPRRGGGGGDLDLDTLLLVLLLDRLSSRRPRPSPRLGGGEGDLEAAELGERPLRGVLSADGLRWLRLAAGLGLRLRAAPALGGGGDRDLERPTESERAAGERVRDLERERVEGGEILRLLVGGLRLFRNLRLRSASPRRGGGV